jgi:hypothetical protein
MTAEECPSHFWTCLTEAPPEISTEAASVLRSASAELRGLGPRAEHDEDGEFVAFTEVHTVWPRRLRHGIAATPPRGHTRASLRRGCSATSPWCP